MTADLQQVCPDQCLRLRLRLLWTDEPQSADPVDQDGGEAAFLALRMARPPGVRTRTARPCSWSRTAPPPVGATTRGGAHPTARHAVAEHLLVTVPAARTIDTVPGGNGEGVGSCPTSPSRWSRRSTRH
ncbi:hypothetical protein [Streptomyces sp. NBC_00273]|uniref:hypothetical protein n=1 Tax=Streptomyces sp. NBC_00273 TaxID=2903644 RepID=UPI002E2CE569|nr:hypothetical protein [Streptomyces sp. NBC_00273]